MPKQDSLGLGKRPRFHNARQGAAMLIYLTAQPETPTHAAWAAPGIIHIHLQTLQRGAALHQRLIQYLAQHLDIEPENIEIVAGGHTGNKVISVYGLSPDELERRLQDWLAAP